MLKQTRYKVSHKLLFILHIKEQGVTLLLVENGTMKVQEGQWDIDQPFLTNKVILTHSLVILIIT